MTRESLKQKLDEATDIMDARLIVTELFDELENEDTDELIFIAYSQGYEEGYKIGKQDDN